MNKISKVIEKIANEAEVKAGLEIKALLLPKLAKIRTMPWVMQYWEEVTNLFETIPVGFETYDQSFFNLREFAQSLVAIRWEFIGIQLTVDKEYYAIDVKGTIYRFHPFFPEGVQKVENLQKMLEPKLYYENRNEILKQIEIVLSQGPRRINRDMKKLIAEIEDYKEQKEAEYQDRLARISMPSQFS